MICTDVPREAYFPNVKVVMDMGSDDEDNIPLSNFIPHARYIHEDSDKTRSVCKKRRKHPQKMGVVIDKIKIMQRFLKDKIIEK